VLAVCSLSHGPGRTRATARLGEALAAQHRRVVAVDTDLAAPALHSALAVSNRTGLAEVARGEAWPSQVLRHADGGCAVVPGGHGQGADATLVAAKPTGMFVHALADVFDYVLLDTPALEDEPEGLPAATLADAALLVGSRGRAGRRDLQRAAELLDAADVPIAGVILVTSGVRGRLTRARHRRAASG
jgi:Mrp family chromosome partitioning ATPase